MCERERERERERESRERESRERERLSLSFSLSLSPGGVRKGGQSSAATHIAATLKKQARMGGGRHPRHRGGGGSAARLTESCDSVRRQACNPVILIVTRLRRPVTGFWRRNLVTESPQVYPSTPTPPPVIAATPQSETRSGLRPSPKIQSNKGKAHRADDDKSQPWQSHA